MVLADACALLTTTVRTAAPGAVGVVGAAGLPDLFESHAIVSATTAASATDTLSRFIQPVLRLCSSTSSCHTERFGKRGATTEATLRKRLSSFVPGRG